MSNRKTALLTCLATCVVFVVVLTLIGFLTESSDDKTQAAAIPIETPTSVPAPSMPPPTPAVHPTPTVTAPLSSPTKTPSRNDFGVARQQVHMELQNLNLGFMPLNKHQDDWYSTMLPNVNIVVDIFGPGHGVKAIETTFRLNLETLSVIDPVMEVMFLTALGEDWEDGLKWVVAGLERLGPDNKKLQQKVGSAYLTLYFLESTESVMFSVDMERQ